MTDFVAKRLTAILKFPDGWGPPRAVELQVVLLVEMWQVAHDRDPYAAVVRYVSFVRERTPPGPQDLTGKFGCDLYASPQFIEILRAFVESEGIPLGTL